MSENKFRPYFSLNWQMANAQHNILKTYAIPVYGHVNISWTYQESKIKIGAFIDGDIYYVESC